jgi:molecular chaperone DnaK
LVKLRNVGDNTAYQIEQQLSEHGDKIPADERAKVEASINNLRATLKGDDAEAIKKANDKLMKDAQTIGKIIYEKAAQQAQPSSADHAEAGPGDGGEGGAPKDDNVIDAEFEVKETK